MNKHSTTLALMSTLIPPLCGCGGGSSSGTFVNGHLVGTYGAKDISYSLQLTPVGGEVPAICGIGGTLTQPVTPDANGHFDAPGVYYYGPYGSGVPVHYVGTVKGNTITLTVAPTDNTIGISTFTVTLIEGQQPPPYTGTCPG